MVSSVEPESTPPWHYGWTEVLFIVALFYLVAGGPPPAVNEAHYLTKAKHYWNPAWCGADVFLDSADPHLTFYWLFGWVTKFCSLTATAWIGRLIIWLLLAAAWQRLSWSLVPQRFVSIATAGLFLLLNQQCHLAGEWVVGGVEAKPVAFALVLAGLRCLVLNQWRAVWLWLGAASALHVLVGGWSVVAAGLCWLTSGRERASLLRMLPALVAGGLLSLAGLLPAVLLSAGTDTDTANLANRIYVFSRLPHHLVFDQFAPLRKLIFGLLVAGWIALSWYLRDQSRWWSINRFAAASLLIALLGIVIGYATGGHPDLAAGLLKFYWFRLADFALPTSVAIGIALANNRLLQSHRSWGRVTWTLAVLFPAVYVATCSVQLQRDLRPGAVNQSRPAARDRLEHLTRRYRAWRQACEWVERETDPHSRFLTPRNQQTFKWYAGRAELACWKDIPQDAPSIVRWWELLESVYTPSVAQRGLGSWSDDQLREIALRYQIDYILVDRGRTDRQLALPRVYPTYQAPNRYFEIYRVYRRNQNAPNSSVGR